MAWRNLACSLVLWHALFLQNGGARFVVAEEIQLEEATENAEVVVALSCAKTKVSLGQTIELEFQIRVDATDFRDQVLFNPWLRKVAFAGGFVAVFDDKGRFLGPIYGASVDREKTPVASDWIHLDKRLTVGAPVSVSTIVTPKEDKGNVVLSKQGKYRFQAVLRRRVRSESPFELARQNVTDTRRTNNPEDEARVHRGLPLKISETDEDYRAELEKQMEIWLHPKFDRIVSRSNILEIEVLAPDEEGAKQ
jgi:hypothetical protein